MTRWPRGCPAWGDMDNRVYVTRMMPSVDAKAFERDLSAHPYLVPYNGSFDGDTYTVTLIDTRGI